MTLTSDRSAERLTNDELRSLFLFEALTDEQLSWFSERGWVVSVPAGATVLDEGAPAEVIMVLLSGVWKSGVSVDIAGTTRELQGIVRDLSLLAIAWASWRLTSASVRHAHHFTWGPIVEVAKLFAGIFLTIIPAIAMLRAGSEGALAPVIALVTSADGRPNDAVYFWVTGALSSFLDNAPTYLVFFNLAGGDAVALMGTMASTLTAISLGAVFMGANTYIGNAPNFMVKAIAEARGVRMPSFFAYLGWAMLVLTPIYALITVLLF